jgi:hypothetical protein
MFKRYVIFSVVLLAVVCSHQASAQADTGAPFSNVGIGVKASLLGAGIEVATPLARCFNLRAGFNAFSYNRGFHKDGVVYNGQLSFRSTEAHLDWFPFGGSFHISPGLLAYNGNEINANASVSAGQTFTLNGVTYTSDPADPIIGAGKVDFKKSGPMLTAGFGNLVPRNHHHISIPFELGAIYTGAPRTTLNLNGGACDANGQFCETIDNNPSFQSNVQAEQTKLQKDVSAFKFYPVLSLGFGFKF